jgi:hypothetical protein
VHLDDSVVDTKRERLVPFASFASSFTAANGTMMPAFGNLAPAGNGTDVLQSKWPFVATATKRSSVCRQAPLR